MPTYRRPCLPMPPSDCCVCRLRLRLRLPNLQQRHAHPGAGSRSYGSIQIPLEKGRDSRRGGELEVRDFPCSGWHETRVALAKVRAHDESRAHGLGELRILREHTHTHTHIHIVVGV